MLRRNCPKLPKLGKLFILFALCTFGQAEETRWVLPNTLVGNWNSPENWSSTSVPTESALVLVENGGTVLFDNGQATVNLLSVGDVEQSILRQTGGQLTTNNFLLATGSRYEFHGGTHQVGDHFEALGTIEFGPQNANIFATDSATVDLSRANLINPGQLDFIGGANSTLLLPPGMDPATAFHHFETAGNVFNVLGEKLIVPQMFVMDIRGDRPDRIRVEGMLRPEGSPSSPIDLLLDEGGIEVAAGGDFNMFNRSITNRSSLEVLGGDLRNVGTLVLGDVAGEQAVFRQTSGLSTMSSLQMARVGNTNADPRARLEMSGGTMNITGSTWLGIQAFSNRTGFAQADWIQTGGDVNIGGSYVMASIPNAETSLLLNDGQLNVSQNFTAATQTNSQADITIHGDLNVGGYFSLATNSNSQADMTLNGGQTNIGGDFTIGTGSNSTTRLTINDGMLNIRGTTTVAPATGQSVARINQTGGQFTSQNLIIQPSGQFEIRGGAIVVGSRFDMLGELLFGDGSPIEIRSEDNAIVDWSRGTLVGDAGNVAFFAGRDSESYFPEGFNPFEQFRLFQSDGLVHSTNTTLLVPISFSGRIRNLNANRLLINGEISIEEDGNINARSVELQDGILQGSGTVTATTVRNNGVIAPGEPIGTLQIVGDYEQANAGTLKIHVGQNDGQFTASRLIVDGRTTLDGNVELVLTESLPMLDSDTSYNFRILESTMPLTGSFTEQPGHVQFGLFGSLRQANDFVDLDLYQAAPGDSNGDGIFNSADLVNIFQTGEFEDDIANNSDWTEGDWNHDGDFTTGDLVTAFQAGTYNPNQVVNVPEPDSFLPALLAACIFAVNCGRRQTKRKPNQC
ncbi:MAG: hypothetical protein R3C28_04215 [Pirellulaceae bacterium]